jgi:hypothetical protein
MNKFFFWVGGRKFFGLILATVLLCFSKIPPEIWLTAYLLFAGSNVYQDYLKTKSGGTK